VLTERSLRVQPNGCIFFLCVGMLRCVNARDAVCMSGQINLRETWMNRESPEEKACEY